jgi:hypothetical protein
MTWELFHLLYTVCRSWFWPRSLWPRLTKPSYCLTQLWDRQQCVCD